MPLPPILEGTALPGSESQADRYLAHEINVGRDAQNALEFRINALEHPVMPAPIVVLTLTKAQELQMGTIPIGGTGVLLSFDGQVLFDFVRQV